MPKLPTKSKPRKAPPVRKPGLLMRALTLDIQPAKKAHRLKCGKCNKVPKNQRLHIVIGAGRYLKTGVLCPQCGVMLLQDLNDQFIRAEYALTRLYAEAATLDLRTLPVIKKYIPKTFLPKEKKPK